MGPSHVGAYWTVHMQSVCKFLPTIPFSNEHNNAKQDRVSHTGCGLLIVHEENNIFFHLIYSFS